MKKLNICFDGRILYQGLTCNSGRTGIYFVAKNIVKILNTKNLNLYLFFDEQDDKISMVLKELSLNIPSENILTKESDFSNIDVFFSPVFAFPDVINRYPKISQYNILYDIIPLLFPEYFASADNSWFKNTINQLSSDKYYFAISEHTKKDFLKYFPVLNPDNIEVIPLSTNQQYKINKNENCLKEIKEKYHIPEDKKYLFSLCSLEPRKNLIRAVKNFVKFIEKNNIDDIVYVLGGAAWDGFIEKFKAEVPEYEQYKDKIIRAGYIDDEDLEVLYSNAEWFVYTSQYEGFGMPPLEAMACACPVITSNNSSLPEVVGDAGIMIDYDSDEQHIEAYEKYYFDNNFRQEMAQKGIERSKLFSWDKAVKIILNKMYEVEAKKAQQPLVTIITPSFNLLKGGRKEWFIQNLESVKNQTYPNIEHIVIDGASTDGTIELLKEYQDKGWIKYYSEPDKGIYDALNKGILKANGKYVVCLNSDDFYCNNQAVEFEVMKLEENDADACYANSKVIDAQTEKLNCVWRGENALRPSFGDIPNHQTFMIKTDVMKELGLYNLNYKVSADSNFIYKLCFNNKKFVYVDAEIIGYRNDGFSYVNPAICLQNQEDSFDEFWGEKLCLTKKDIHNLAHGNFAKLSLNDAIKLGSKLQYSYWIEEYYKYLIETIKAQLINEYMEQPVTFKRAIKVVLTYIFSVKNSKDKKHKIIMICGVRIKLKKLKNK